MSDELGAELAEFLNDLFEREESLVGQHGVECFNGVAFAHDETVAVRIVRLLRADIHLFKIKLDQDVHHRHIAADVAALAGHDHVYGVFAECKGHGFQITHFVFFPFSYAIRLSDLVEYDVFSVQVSLYLILNRIVEIRLHADVFAGFIDDRNDIAVDRDAVVDVRSLDNLRLQAL